MWSGRPWVGHRGVAVRGMDGLVVAHAAGQAVPEHFEPAVAQRAESGVVAVVIGDVPVVELPGPPGTGQGPERPLLHRVSQVPVARQPACDDVLARPGAPGHTTPMTSANPEFNFGYVGLIPDPTSRSPQDRLT